MALTPLLQLWKPEGGKSRRFTNTQTGESISRRQLDKLRDISYEKKAQRNREKDAAAQILRPAKGRKSAQKITGEFKEEVAKARLETRAQKEKRIADKKAADALARKIETGKKKKVHQKKVSRGLLRAGRMSARIEFEDYAGYLKAWGELQAMKSDVVGYALGVIVVDTTTGKRRALFTTSLLAAKMKLSATQFDERTEMELTYSEKVGFMMHIAFRETFARAKAEKAGIKIKNRKQTR